MSAIMKPRPHKQTREHRIHLERVFWIDQQVRAGHYPNARTIAEHFEVAPKTAQRTLDFMRDRLRLPLGYSTGRRGWYYTEPAYALPAIELTEGDLVAILLEEDEGLEPNSYPLQDGQSLRGLEPVRLLMPDSGGTELMDALLIETSAMRKKKQLDPPGTRWVTYVRDSKALTLRRAAPMRRTAAKALTNIARYVLDSTVLPLPQDTLPFAELVRRALIRNRVDTSHSEVITGKHKDGTPLDGHEHAHYFPTDEDHDGRIDHITIYSPRGFDQADLDALGSLRTVFRSGNRPEVRMVLTGLGGQELIPRAPGTDACAPRQPSVSLFAEAKRWRSVTPFSLPRFPNRGGGKPPRPRDLPEAQLIRELKNRGLPEPVSIKRIEGYQVGGIPPEGGTTKQRPLVRWLEFHTIRHNGTKGNGLAGFEIEFAEPVRGPIAVGFACHFGLGLFLPVS